MTREEHMKKTLELKNILRPNTLKHIHLIGLNFMGMTSMLMRFSNGASLYIKPRTDDCPTASMGGERKFIPEDSYEMMNAIFINPKNMGRKLTTEEKTILKFIDFYLDDPGVEKIQMVIDKDNYFLKNFYPNQSAYIFGNKLTIVKR